MGKKDMSKVLSDAVRDGPIISFNDEILKAINDKAVTVNKANSHFAIENVETGLMGQAAVSLTLKGDLLEGVNQMKLEPDEYDLLYRGCMLEIKTFYLRGWYIEREYKPRSWMIVPLRQFRKPERHYPFYIGCLRISTKEICIMGFVLRKFLENLKERGSTARYDESEDPNSTGIIVKNRDDFVGIEHLDTAIDEYLRGLKS